ncbi:MAG: hypothetical protein LBR49_01705 [Tannerella sp.]|nr:hypothetical protein [Tannerella sp.]
MTTIVSPVSQSVRTASLGRKIAAKSATHDVVMRPYKSGCMPRGMQNFGGTIPFYRANHPERDDKCNANYLDVKNRYSTFAVYRRLAMASAG